MDQKFIEKARIELGEDEQKKDYCLKRFRELISKSEFLKASRQDDVFLLQFLRVRKFNTDAAFQTLERCYLSYTRFPAILGNFVENMPKITEMLKSGVVCPLSERDSEGRKVILVMHSRWDTNRFSVYDGLKLLVYICTVLMEEEETQICGMSFVYDFTNCTLKHMMPPKDLNDFLQVFKHGSSIRMKNALLLNMPAFGSFILKIAKMILSEKLMKRVNLDTRENIKNHIEPNILPKEYGGNDKAIDEMIEDFFKLQKKFKINEESWKFPFESGKLYNKNWSEPNEIFGSFRKLEID